MSASHKRASSLPPPLPLFGIAVSSIPSSLSWTPLPSPFSPHSDIEVTGGKEEEGGGGKQHNNSFPLGSSPSLPLFLVAHFLNPSSSFARGYSGNGAQTPLVPGRTNERTNAAPQKKRVLKEEETAAYVSAYEQQGNFFPSLFPHDVRQRLLKKCRRSSSRDA